MNKKDKLSPKLRFPEFVNEGEWKLKMLGNEDISHFVNKKIGVEKLTVDSYISTENMLPDYTGVKKAVRLPLSGSFTKFLKGDILVSNIRPYLKKVWKADKNGGASNDVIVFRPGSEVTTDYLEFLLKNDAFINYVMKSAKGVKMPRGEKNAMLDYSVCIPARAEQQKIASFLSSLDEVITAHTQKLEAFKEHKKGLMQNLFPQEGEMVPKKRFPEFLAHSSWKKKSLGEVCKMQAGKFINASEIKSNLTEGHFPCYGGNGLRGFTNSFTHTGTYSLIGRQGALCGNVILASGQFHATEHAIVVTPESDTDKNWLFYVLEFLNLNVYATGQAQPGLSVATLEKLELSAPSDPKEQKKIAYCLMSIDALIIAEEEVLEQLKLHKKGLMQRLFPKTDQ